MTPTVLRDFLDSGLSNVELDRWQSPEISTGHAELDQILGGLRPGLVHLLTGYPGVGTSTLALDMARATAIKAGRPALVVTPAVPAEEVLLRVLSAEAKVLSTHLRTGRMSDDDWKRLAAWTEQIVEAPLVVDDTVYPDISELEPVLDAGHERAPWRLLVLDGAALLARRSAPEHLWAAHTRLAADVKRIARRRNIPVVLTAPAGRQLVKRASSTAGVGNAPQIGDVAVSAAYEAEADVVIGVSRPDQFDRTSLRAGEADLILLKSRYGPTGVVTVAFQGHYARFMDLAT